MIQQVVGAMILKHEINDRTFDEIDPWVPILHNITWEIRSTYHTTTQASLGQLVFGRDMLFISMSLTGT